MKFITINGSKVWITEKENLQAAINSAQNICDHSKVIIVREVTEFTDYTKEYFNQ